MSTAVASATEPTSGLGLALVKQELECGVCLDLYERPVTLACGHSLCEGCAKHMVGMEKSGSAFIRCPHCRAKTRWKSGKANLKVNITLQNMVDRVKRAQKVQADEEVLKEQQQQQQQQEEEQSKQQHLKPPQADKAAKRKAKESHSSTETTPVSDLRGDDWVSQPRSPPAAALPDSSTTTTPLLVDLAATTSPRGLSSSPHDSTTTTTTSTKGKERSYGDATATMGPSSGSALPFGVVADLEELPAGSFPNADAVAAFDAAIAALLSPEAEKQSASLCSSSSLGTSPRHQASGLFSAQEVGLVCPARGSGPLPDHQPRIAVTEPQQQQDRVLLDEQFHEGFFPSLLPLAEESSERKRERKERRERSSRPNGTSEWDDSRERLSRSCRSPAPNSPPTRGRSEQLSLSQDTDRRSRSRSRGRQEREVTIVYDGIPEEYFELLMGQHGPLQRVEQSTNCKIKSTDQQGPMRGIAITGHPDDVRQARKQLVALIRESALQQDRWASGSGESKTSPSSALVKKKMNISRRQYELLLSNDMQLLHSIEATTETSVIFPTNSTSSRASSVPITIVGKREGVLITVDFLKANEEAAAKTTGSSIVGPPSRSQSATVPVSAARAATTRSLGSSRSATHGKRRRRRVPATEGRVPGCVIS